MLTEVFGEAHITRFPPKRSALFDVDGDKQLHVYTDGYVGFPPNCSFSLHMRNDRSIALGEQLSLRDPGNNPNPDENPEIVLTELVRLLGNEKIVGHVRKAVEEKLIALKTDNEALIREIRGVNTVIAETIARLNEPIPDNLLLECQKI